MQRREQERARSACRIENRDRLEAPHVLAAPLRDGALGQRVDDAFRRVEAPAGRPLILGHQRFEDFSEHLGIDVRASGVDLVDAECKALEDVVDHALHEIVRKREARAAALERGWIEQPAVEIRDIA